MLKEMALTITITLVIFFALKGLELVVFGEVQDRITDDILMIIVIHFVHEAVAKTE